MTQSIKTTDATSQKTAPGRDCNPDHFFRKHNLDTASTVLLVDDEREFVQTLSERLELRGVGTAIAYDGASALDLVHADAPEVMIIDLKMPGINGLEVLKRVKTGNPEIEVIVLTGHGSSDDEQKCIDLGAFAYLQKPVDINRLSQILQKAQAKIHKNSQKSAEAKPSEK